MFDYYTMAPHTYSLSVSGLKVKTKRFASRQAANKAMYKLIGKYDLQLAEVYDDKHYKTYLFTNGVRFYINRD